MIYRWELLLSGAVKEINISRSNSIRLWLGDNGSPQPVVYVLNNLYSWCLCGFASIHQRGWWTILIISLSWLLWGPSSINSSPRKPFFHCTVSSHLHDQCAVNSAAQWHRSRRESAVCRKSSEQDSTLHSNRCWQLMEQQGWSAASQNATHPSVDLFYAQISGK